MLSELLHIWKSNLAQSSCVIMTLSDYMWCHSKGAVVTVSDYMWCHKVITASELGLQCAHNHFFYLLPDKNKKVLTFYTELQRY